LRRSENCMSQLCIQAVLHFSIYFLTLHRCPKSCSTRSLWIYYM